MHPSRPVPVRTFYWSLLLMAIAGVGVAIFIAMNWAGMQWAWSLMLILLAYLAAMVVVRFSPHEGIVDLLEMFIPGVHTYVELQKKKYVYRGLIDNVEYVLGYFQLIRHLSPEYRVETSPGSYQFSESFRELLLGFMRGVHVEKSELDNLIQRTAEALSPALMEEVLQLLYKEIFKDGNEATFSKIKNNPQMIQQLAQVLFQSGRLPPASDQFPYDEKLVQKVLAGLDEFSLKAVYDGIQEGEHTWKLTQQYIEFLTKNQAVDGPYRLDLDKFFEPAAHISWRSRIDEDFSNICKTEKSRALAALLTEGDTALKGGPLSNECDSKALAALNLTSLAMFFTEERLDSPELKSAVCMLASRSETAVDQYLAYLQAREELRPESPLADLPYVSVNYVARNCLRIVEKLSNNSLYLKDKEIATDELRNGNWWTRVPLLMEKLFRNIEKVYKDEINKINETLKGFRSMEDILRRIFRGLKLETIERLLEAQTSIPYLLTFDGLKGNLAELIDSLSYFDGKRNREKLAEKNIVEFKFENQEKYFFKKYIRNSRLGVVPRTMNFDLFKETFEADLIKVFKKRNLLHLEHPKIDKFEIIIHRFGLHGRDRYGFDNVRCNSQYKHALPKIRDLFASSLTPQEILNAIIYEQPMDGNGRLNMRPILEGILKEGMVWDFTDEDNVNLSENCIKTLIKNDSRLKLKVCKTLNRETLLDAAKFLHESVRAGASGIKNDQISVLTLEIKKLPGFSKLENEATVIASNYVDLMLDIAYLLSTLAPRKI